MIIRVSGGPAPLAVTVTVQVKPGLGIIICIIGWALLMISMRQLESGLGIVAARGAVRRSVPRPPLRLPPGAGALPLVAGGTSAAQPARHRWGPGNRRDDGVSGQVVREALGRCSRAEKIRLRRPRNCWRQPLLFQAKIPAIPRSRL